MTLYVLFSFSIHYLDVIDACHSFPHVRISFHELFPEFLMLLCCFLHWCRLLATICLSYRKGWHVHECILFGFHYEETLEIQIVQSNDRSHVLSVIYIICLPMLFRIWVTVLMTVAFIPPIPILINPDQFHSSPCTFPALLKPKTQYSIS